ncbi:MAG TPA: DUF2339 domain-containing protein [Phycisphaerae bacterium]|nr:DUF2339 domain-containing protein [Phycisphaerae bacterium]
MAGFVCLGVFLCLVPLVFSIVALTRLRGLKGELRAVRKQTALLEAQVNWLVEQFKAGTAKKREAAPAAIPAATAVLQQVVEPAQAVEQSPVMETPPVVEQPRTEAKDEAFARLTKQLPELVPGPEPQLPPLEEEPRITMAGALSMEEPAGAGRGAASTPPRPSVPLEQRLIQVAVAVGGVALALAGIFLVKVAFDRNYLNPFVRVVLGTVFGVALLGAGVWRRKKEAGIAQALSAAGVADLFACFLAATNLYHLVSPLTGFGLLAATTALAVVLSLAQGPFVALLGLVGGFLTPALIHTDHPSSLSLFGYLFLLHVGLTLVSRARGWAWLAALTVLASQAWVVIWLATQPWSPADGQVMGIFVLVSAFAVLGASLGQEAWGKEPSLSEGLSYLAVVIGLVLSGALLARSDFSNTEWAFLGLLSAACLVLAGLRSMYEPLAWAAAALVWAMLAWSGHGWEPAAPPDVHRLAVILAIFGTGFAAAAYGLAWRAQVPERWASLSMSCAVAYMLLAYWVIGRSPRTDLWAWLPVGLAVVYAGLSVPVYQRRARAGWNDFLETLVIGVLALFVTAPPMAFERATLTAVWSVLVPVSVLAVRLLRLRLPWIMAALVTTLVGLRLLLNPIVLDYGTGPSLWWNPVVWGYVPTACMLAAAVWLAAFQRPAEEAGGADMSGYIEAVAGLVVVAFATLFTHRIFNPATLDTLKIGIAERAALGNVWTFLGIALVLLGVWLRRFRGETTANLGKTLLVAAIVFVVLIEGVWLNPLFTTDSLGVGWANLLWPLFALPAAGLGAMALWLRRRETEAPALLTLCGTASLVLLFAFVSLMIRHAFNGPVLDITGGSAAEARIAERSTYPLLWLLMGTAMLVCGRKWRVMGLSVAGQLFAAAGTACVVLVAVLAFNPLMVNESVGAGSVVNWLLYAYGAPALLAGGLGIWLHNTAEAGERGEMDRAVGRAHGVAALLFLFVLVSLEVRRAFQGPILSGGHPGSAEMYAYSAAWAIFGTLLLLGGIVTRSAVLRWASLAVMLVTILKVFLLDVASLSDVLRIFSLLGLGLSLILLALLYHYCVFRAPAEPPPAGPADEATRGAAAPSGPA